MSTLKQLVDETTNIKNELKTCHANLKNNLIEKSIECSSTDKLLSLVNKVGEIELGKKWATGKAQTNATNVEGAITVSGLSFRPSIVIMCGNRGDDDLMIGGLYVQGHNKNRNIAYYYDLDDFEGGTGSKVVGNSTNDECYIVDNGFRLLATWVNTQQIYNITWYAFE